MKRRRVLALGVGATIALPLPARAQPQPAMPVVGFLSSAAAEAVPVSPAFHDGLKEHGYTEGRNVAFAFRYADGDLERLPALASELVALKVAVIVTASPPPVLAAKKVTQTTPVVFLVGGDPVARGLVASLARPGGNATGIAQFTAELTPKRLQLLRDLIPTARSVTLLLEPVPRATDHHYVVRELAEVQAAARLIGLDVTIVEAGTAHEVEQAFARMAERRPDALLVSSGVLLFRQRAHVIGLAARQAIPAIYPNTIFVTNGGLLSYGPSINDMTRLLGTYTGKILAGAKPADLPVQRPTKFELVINLKTAKALDLTIPPAILDRATEVIK